MKMNPRGTQRAILFSMTVRAPLSPVRQPPPWTMKITGAPDGRCGRYTSMRSRASAP
jgi:hypothetical protein